MVVAPTVMVEATAIEIPPVFSFKVGTIVLEVDAIAIVATPGGVLIVDVAGVLGFTNGRRRIVSTVIFGCWLLIYRGRLFIHRCRCDIYPGAGNPEADMGIYVYLGITFGSDEAGAYNGGEDG
jgi:hypothetical protein